MPASNDRHLHSLRVDCKRLRYAIEFFAPVLGSSVESFLEQITSMQDTLGRINDIAIFVASTKGLDVKSAEQAALVENYVAHRNNELVRLRTTFYAQWTRFNTRALQRKFSDALLVLR